MVDEAKVGVKLYGEIASIDASDLESNIRQTNENFSQDMDGIITSTVTYIGEYKKIIKHARESENHPTFDDLVRTNYGVQRMAGNLGTCTCTYKGCMDGDYFTRYSIDSSTKAEPIQTHPFFKEGKDIPKDSPDAHKEDDAFGYRFGDEIVGAPNGSAQAFFERSGTAGGLRFKYFPKEANYNLPGVTQYLDFSVVLKVIIVSHAPDDFKNKIDELGEDGGYLYAVGSRNDPPIDVVDLDLFSEAKGEVDAQYNWLVTAVSHEIIGSAWRQEIDFTLSGYLGWNALIYRSSEKDGLEDTRFDGSLLSE
jgi:hypothetical protein